MGLKLSGLISLIDCDYLENDIDFKINNNYYNYNNNYNDNNDNNNTLTNKSDDRYIKNKYNKNDCRIDIRVINNCKNINYEGCLEGSPNGWGFYEDISIDD